ncbi:MAG: hypothetical protein K0R63_767 [Rickettsiales bacterium]|jgi:hypothetical protein|nr:hypothetical protein [Rickettsiales bacterium]
MFNRSHFYLVYVNPNADRVTDSALFVRDGFSWMAAVLHFFWLGYHRIWKVAGIIFLLFMLLGILEAKDLISPALSYAIQVSLFLFIGFSATDWYVSALEDRGYVLTDIIAAHDELEASQRFFGQYTQANKSISTSLSAPFSVLP